MSHFLVARGALIRNRLNRRAKEAHHFFDEVSVDPVIGHRFVVASSTGK
jgi:hypothetical protein